MLTVGTDFHGGRARDAIGIGSNKFTNTTHGTNRGGIAGKRELKNKNKNLFENLQNYGEYSGYLSIALKTKPNKPKTSYGQQSAKDRFIRKRSHSDAQLNFTSSFGSK